MARITESVHTLVERATVAQLFNMWMQKYIDHPEEFEAEFLTVMEYLAESTDGKEPTYGEQCVAYMEHLLNSDEFVWSSTKTSNSSQQTTQSTT